jgi:hypothetical protein
MPAAAERSPKAKAMKMVRFMKIPKAMVVLDRIWP